jgi:hypothetical protein
VCTVYLPDVAGATWWLSPGPRRLWPRPVPGAQQKTRLWAGLLLCGGEPWMEPRRLELLTPCMPFRRFGGQESLPGRYSDKIITNHVRRFVRRFAQLHLRPAPPLTAGRASNENVLKDFAWPVHLQQNQGSLQLLAKHFDKIEDK